MAKPHLASFNRMKNLAQVHARRTVLKMKKQSSGLTRKGTRSVNAVLGKSECKCDQSQFSVLNVVSIERTNSGKQTVVFAASVLWDNSKATHSKTTQLISLQTQYLYPIPVLSHVYIDLSLYKSE